MLVHSTWMLASTPPIADSANGGVNIGGVVAARRNALDEVDDAVTGREVPSSDGELFCGDPRGGRGV